MSFPEGKGDWVKLMQFLVLLFRMVSEVFFGENPDSGEKHGE